MAMLKGRFRRPSEDVASCQCFYASQMKRRAMGPGRLNDRENTIKKENEPNTNKATLEKRIALEGDSCTCYTRVPVDYFQSAR